MASNLERRLAWSKAYARQAAADFETWNKLQGNKNIPRCHKLMFVQMACEKLVKAYLCKSGTDPVTLQSSHAYIAKTLPVIVRQRIDAAWLARHCKHLAHEIEMLAPAVKRGGQRPDNCEYPWEDELGQLHVPIDWTFAPSGLLMGQAGRAFLKLVREAIGRFL